MAYNNYNNNSYKNNYKPKVNEQINNLVVYDEETLRNLMIQFIELLQATKREGIDDLIMYLTEETDFFTAPGSTIYHSDYIGGLLVHSINVYNRLRSVCQLEQLDTPMDTIIIAGALHDLCKANQYKQVKKVFKNDDTDKWYDYQTYKFSNEKTLPLGHGEKSVMILQKYIRLTDLEMVMIRWHMGATEENALREGLNDAYHYDKAVSALHIADMMASNFDEFTVDHQEVKAKNVNMISSTEKLDY